jgi:NADP-dependent 3-hydroxy acid dehydrogenase YdfG
MRVRKQGHIINISSLAGHLAVVAISVCSGTVSILDLDTHRERMIPLYRLNPGFGYS